MPLNLITDPWIPVVRNGARAVIRPDQIAERGIERLDWPRPDLNLACLELLIGLVYLADPPEDPSDHRTRLPDPERLRARLAPWAPAFNLTGDPDSNGPRFLQDIDPLEGAPTPLDMLFIDSAGDNTAKNNADLMVRRDRYPALSLPLAAMALYTLQAFAPSGGAGNRTSMRGGGPMVTLAMPQAEGIAPLWPLVWANVPEVSPGDAWLADEMAEVLPWMRPTRTSESGQITTPPDGPLSPECFFGMPRRLRLRFAQGTCAISGAQGAVATGVIQRPYGTNYDGWVHPLTPYYLDAKKQKLPKHPKPGHFGYPGWLGVLFQTETGDKATSLQAYQARHQRAQVLVGGWAMDNMKPLDFIWSQAPLFPLSPEAETRAVELVLAAEQAAFALMACLKAVLVEPDSQKGTVARVRETFFEQTQSAFEAALAGLSNGDDPAKNWLGALQDTALVLFDRNALAQILHSDMNKSHITVEARRRLVGAFYGYPPFGGKLFGFLDMPVPAKPKKADPNKEDAA